MSYVITPGENPQGPDGVYLMWFRTSGDYKISQCLSLYDVLIEAAHISEDDWSILDHIEGHDGRVDDESVEDWCYHHMAELYKRTSPVKGSIKYHVQIESHTDTRRCIGELNRQFATVELAITAALSLQIPGRTQIVSRVYGEAGYIVVAGFGHDRQVSE